MKCLKVLGNFQIIRLNYLKNNLNEVSEVLKKSVKVEKKLESLFKKYEEEVKEAEEKGYLMENTVKTYLTHSRNFVKWCKGNFELGGRNKG